MAKQATKDAIEYQKLLNKKNEEIQELNLRLQQASRVMPKGKEILMRKPFISVYASGISPAPSKHREITS